MGNPFPELGNPFPDVRNPNLGVSLLRRVAVVTLFSEIILADTLVTKWIARSPICYCKTQLSAQRPL